MPKKVQENILRQERNIENSINESIKQEKMASFLQKATKKDKKDLLLFNNVYSRMKNEVNDCIESTQNNTKYDYITSW